MSTTLGEVASILRSKNAGPYLLTLDVFFDSAEVFNQVKMSGVITDSLVSRCYGIDKSDVINLGWHDSARGLKITIVRPAVSGSPRDRDVYGCQQHAPLLGVKIPTDI